VTLSQGERVYSSYETAHGLVLVAACLLPLCASGAREIEDGESLVRAMHTRYANSWYDTLRFTQKSTTYNADGAMKVDTWFEAANLPGKLRVDFGPPSDGNGAILVDGSVTFFKKGQQAGTRSLLNLFARAGVRCLSPAT
jgi:hypothetical protein